MKDSLGGFNVPASPPLGVWKSSGDWCYGWKELKWPRVPTARAIPPFIGMSSSAFNSAARAGVFLIEPRGPRGGNRFAVRSLEAWESWREVYFKRVEGRAIGESRRRLGGARE